MIKDLKQKLKDQIAYVDYENKKAVKLARLELEQKHKQVLHEKDNRRQEENINGLISFKKKCYDAEFWEEEFDKL